MLIKNLKMKKYNYKKLLRPDIIIILSTLFSVLITFFPRVIYEKVIYEKQMYFMNFKVITLVVFLGFSSYLGVKISKKVKWTTTYNNNKRKGPPYLSLIILLISICTIMLFILVLNKDVLFLILTGKGFEFRNDLNIFGIELGTLLVFMLPLIIYQVHYSMNNKSSKWVNNLILIIVILFLGLLFIIQARYLIFPTMLSVLIIYLIRDKQKERNLFTILLVLFISLSVVFVIFNIVTIFRIGKESSSISSHFIAYTTTGINRLSYILEGKLDMPFQGSTYNILRTLWYPPVVNKVIDMSKLGNGFGLNLPNPSTYYDYLKNALSSSNLRESYVWITVYGQVYTELGIFSFIYFFFIGFLSNIFYSKMLNKELVGLVIYPIMLFSILFWFGDNFLNYPDFFIIVISTLVLNFITRLTFK